MHGLVGGCFSRKSPCCCDGRFPKGFRRRPFFIFELVVLWSITAASEAQRKPAILILGMKRKFAIERQSDLQAALESLYHLSTGRTAKLVRGPKHYIEAVRHNDLWAVTTRRGSHFTLASFTAEISTDYSDREVKESRAAGSIWECIKGSILSPSPDRSLSTAQVGTLFAEFFAGRTFSLPQSGA